jgi:hypothetical protein
MLDWYELLVIILINGFIDCVFVAWLAGRRSRQALEAWLESEKSEEALKHILETAWEWVADNNKMAEVWNWVMSSQIETGNLVKTVDDDGVEKTTKETTTPFIAACRGVAQYVKMGILGKSGLDKQREKEFMQTVAADLQDPANPLGSVMRTALPGALLRAQKTGDYQPLIQLVIGQYLQEYMKKRQPGTAPAAAQPSNEGLRF